MCSTVTVLYELLDLKKVYNIIKDEDHDFLVGSRILKNQKNFIYKKNYYGVRLITAIINYLFNIKLTDSAGATKMIKMAEYKKYTFKPWPSSVTKSRKFTAWIIHTIKPKVEAIIIKRLNVSFINFKGNSIGCKGVFSIFGEKTIILDSLTDNLATLELLDYIEVNFHSNRIFAISNTFT